MCQSTTVDKRKPFFKDHCVLRRELKPESDPKR